MQTNAAAINLRYMAFVEIIAVYIMNLQTVLSADIKHTLCNAT